MKAVIIAAGMGRRMGEMTRDLPKCLAISWQGMTLFDKQLEVLRSCGIRDIAVVRGYQGDKFRHPQIRYYWNRDYESNNILASLMCASDELAGEVLVLYSDIWFEPAVVKQLIASPHPVAIAVDKDWKKTYEGRTEHPLSEAEGVVLDAQGKVREIGKLGKTDVSGEFIGMMKLQGQGPGVFKGYYARAKRLYDGRAFQRAKVFRQAYLTDMLQELSDAGVAVQGEAIQGGWREIDTVQDFQSLLKHLEAKDPSLKGEQR
ncbi:MAG TPA: phosphocholine cytidylyltransferase family protein [Verrucomicrobiae bacterium]|jgi:choline kinase|nr:phosphocholine cytidylyltransferase family protein [Verrucomicrobiae bacterium]